MTFWKRQNYEDNIEDYWLPGVRGEGINKESTEDFCCCSVAQPCLTLAPLWASAGQASLSFTISQSLLNLMSIEPVIPSNHLILCRPLLLLPSIFPTMRVFSNESALRIRWPKYLSFRFSISPSNEYPGLISFKIDWSNLLSVQSQESSSTTIQKHLFFLWFSAFFFFFFIYLY